MASGTVPMPNHGYRRLLEPSHDRDPCAGSQPGRQSPTIYVVEPRGNSVYADARLKRTPVTVALDVQPLRPAADRDDLLAFPRQWPVMTVDVGSNQFAYRFPGVLRGALLSLSLYLLARFLFRRRSVAVIVSLLVLVTACSLPIRA